LALEADAMIFRAPTDAWASERTRLEQPIRKPGKPNSHPVRSKVGW
jgi:hypothetical protein